MATKNMFKGGTKTKGPEKSCCSAPAAVNLPKGVTQQKLDEMIRVRAYYIWEKNGKKGDSQSNWLKAKQEVYRDLKIK